MSPTEFTHSPVIPIAAPFDLTDYPELAGIEAITGTGLVARTGTGTYATRTIAVPAAGITISNAGGVAGNPTLALANDLAALEALSSTGIAVRSTTDTWVQRTITGTTNQISVSNGDGVSGNPTLSTPQNIHTGASPTFVGITLSGMTSGSVLFAGTGGIVSQDNAGLFYDDAANTLRVGAASTTASGGLIQLATGTTAASGILWGTDTNLYRSAANTLKTDDALTIADTTASTSSTTGALIVSGGVGIAKDSWINSVRVGLGGGNLSNNLVIGTSALAATNSGTGKNIAIGQSALAANTTGYQNIAIGWEAIKTGATGNGNIAIGHSSQTGVTGAANISVGNGNLAYVGANNYNTAIGHASQDTATSQYNTSVGGLTLRAASGLSNAAVGYQAGTAVSTGYQNTLIGNSAGVGTTIGFQNTFLGYQAGFHNVSGITNTMVGYNAGAGINSGSYNTIIGAAQWTYPTTLNNNIVLADGQGNIKYRYDATNVTYTANSGYHSFVSTGSAEQVRITHTASANRYITLTGSNGGNPTIDVSAGSLAITPATVFASTISALAITGNSFIPNSATIPTNGMYLEAANNPAFAANSTKIFEYDSTGVQIAGTVTTTGGATFHTTSTALTNGAGAGAGTLTNAPAAGDPTKWIGINDNGTTRYIPAW